MNATTEVVGVGGGYVYYLDVTDGFRINRIKGDGSDKTRLFEDSVESAELKDERIYLYSLGSGGAVGAVGASAGGLACLSADLDGTDLRPEPSVVEVKDGDWRITGREVIDGRTILLKGNLSVGRAASLTLRNSRLVFDTGVPGGTVVQRSFRAEGAGGAGGADGAGGAGGAAAVTLEHSRLTTTNYLGGVEAHFTDTALRVAGSRIAGVGSGFSLFKCDGAVVDGSTFYTRMGFGAVDVDTSDGVIIKGNVIIKEDRDVFSPNIPIHVGKAENTQVKDNVLVRQEETIFLVNGADHTTVSGNLITSSKGTTITATARSGRGPGGRWEST